MVKARKRKKTGWIKQDIEAFKGEFHMTPSMLKGKSPPIKRKRAKRK